MINEFDENLIVPDETEPLCEAVEPWRKNGRRMNIFYGRAIRAFADRMDISKDTPYSKLGKNARRILRCRAPPRPTKQNSDSVSRA